MSRAGRALEDLVFAFAELVARPVEKPRSRGTRLARVRRAGVLALAGLLLARTILSLVMISRPGLQYDETLFVNAATLNLPTFGISNTFLGLPLMLVPYTGALKSWLYYPVFALFGTSPATIRAPVVLLTSAALVLLYLAIRHLVNRPVALVAVIALGFDNSLFWLTRDDVGPSAIEFFLKCAALFCVARFARAASARWVGVLLMVLVLGVFNKLNFIWVVNAAVVVSLILIVRHRNSLGKRRKAVAVWLGGLALLYGCFALYYLGDHIGSSAGGLSQGGLGQPWPVFKYGTASVLSGTWFYDYALAPIGYNQLVVWVTLLLFAAGAVAAVSTRRLRNVPVASLALTTLLIALQTQLTAQATAGWHYISIYPFVTIVASYGAFAIAWMAFGNLSRTYVALACGVAIALAYDGALLARYFDNLSQREPVNVAWSPSIYTLSRYLQHSPAEIFTADWGIVNPLFALHPSPRYTELTFELQSATPSALRALGRALAATPGPKLFVTHPADKAIFPQAVENLATATAGHLRLVKTVDGLDRQPVYLVYAYG